MQKRGRHPFRTHTGQGRRKAVHSRAAHMELHGTIRMGAPQSSCPGKQEGLPLTGTHKVENHLPKIS